MVKFSTLTPNPPKKQVVEEFVKKYRVKNYIVKNDRVNVFGSINLSKKELTELPFAFGIIVGDFIIENNQLTSFHNFPIKVEGQLNCSNNNISSLKDCPKIIKGDFYCQNNLIEKIKLIDLPLEVEGKMFFSHPEKRAIENLEKYYKKVNNRIIRTNSNGEVLVENIEQYMMVRSLEEVKTIVGIIEQKEHFQSSLAEKPISRKLKI